MKHCILLMLHLARALRAPLRPRAVSRLSSWGGDYDEVSTGDGVRKPKRPDTRPDFAKPNYREPRPARGGGRGRGRTSTSSRSAAGGGAAQALPLQPLQPLLLAAATARPALGRVLGVAVEEHPLDSVVEA